MKTSLTRLAVVGTAGCALTLLCAFALNAQAPTPSRYWPQWRGPDSSGVSRTANPPVEWSESKNIRWKREIPGRASSSPVVWGDLVFVTSAVPVGVSVADSHAPRGGQARIPHRYVVMALHRATGEVAWERVAREEQPHEAAHPDNGTWASSSAIVDGQLVIAYFESRGMYAFDLAGKPVWQKDLGDKRMRMEFGEGSTPALFGNTIVVVWDHQGQSFIVALDKRTGNELWRVPRDEIDTWATPLIVPNDGRMLVVTNAMNRVSAYDLDTGALAWQAPGTTMNAIPSPVYEDGLVFLAAGFRGNNLKAIRLAGAKGDLTNTPAIVWQTDRDTPYVPSLLIYDSLLYVLKTNSGILSVLDAKTGKPHYQLQRLDGVPNVFASPVGAGGRVYIPGREGSTLVIRNATAYQVLAKNDLQDAFDASPALVDGEIYLRGNRYLYCIAEK